MEEKQKRKGTSGVKVVIAAFAIGLFLCVGFFAVMLGVLTNILAPASDVTHAFMDALHDEEFEVAFDMFSSGLKSEVETADNLQSLILENNAKPESWTFNNQSVENNSGRFSGEVTLENGATVPITVLLVFENDEWRIISYVWGE